MNNSSIIYNFNVIVPKISNATKIRFFWHYCLILSRLLAKKAWASRFARGVLALRAALACSRRAIRSITFAHFVSLMRFGGSATIPLACALRALNMKYEI
jgi:hypothetical protein